MRGELPTPERPFRLGTRGSPLALAQAHEARARLMRAFELPEAAFGVVVIRTTGDRIQDRSLRALGGKGLFTREIEAALEAGEIDAAVHSMKDMPTQQPAALIIDCHLPRADPRDAFLSPQVAEIGALRAGHVVGTSSLRRRAQTLWRRPDLRVVEFRGNLQTRLRKLGEGVADCTFLAMAGLGRLGMTDRARGAVAPDAMLPALAQGVIGLERRCGDDRAGEMLAAIHDAETGLALAAERAFLAALDGSCETPIGGLAERHGAMLRLRGEILRPDGSEALEDADSAPVGDGAAMGRAMGERLRARAGPGFFAAG